MNKQQFDEKIDDLIQDAASNVHLAFNEEAWQKMEVLLDKKEKRRRIIFWWWLTPLALVLLVTSIYYLYSGNNNLQSTEKKISATNSLQTESNKKNMPIVFESNSNLLKQKAYDNKKITNNSKTVSELQENINKANELIPTQKETSVTNSFTLKKSITNRQKNSSVNRTETSNATKQTTTHFSGENNRTTIKTLTAKETSETKNVDVRNNKTTEQQQKTTTLTAKEKDTITITQKKKNQDSSVTINDSTKNNITNKTKSKPKKSVLSNFEISITGAADMTTVKFKKTDAISTAFGFGITYFLNKKISISTGIGIAKKLYNADSVDYKKVSYLPWYSRLTNIAANCRVIEVPLNIQYNLKTKGSTSWIAVAGISNYFMKSEDYVYEYTVSGVPKTAAYSYSNKNNHLLSIVNLALAYRKTINTQWSWQVAPFAKIPLTGVGEGKVQLSSIGLQGSVHFKLKK